jgi:quercetin dioxygenase-like cupin family protein
MILPSSVESFRAACLVVTVCAFASPGFAEVNAGKPMVVVPADEGRFVPVDPKRPDGAQMAVLRGDPAKGPSTMLLKFKRATGVLHVHTSDYELVILQGTMKHWGERDSEAAVKPLGPGSYWFQPGGQPHADSCLSDECVMFITWAGKRDARLPDAPNK